MQAWHWALLLGIIMLWKGLFLLAAPEAAAHMAKGFARHVWCGRVLATLAWAWAGWALYVMPLELIDPVRKWIPLLILAAIPLSWIWMSDLLGCRAVGALLVLFPSPLLLVTRFHPSPWRLAAVIFTYIAIVAGMVLILYPYHMRDALAWFAARPARLRASGIALLALGAFFLVLGVVVLR